MSAARAPEAFVLGLGAAFALLFVGLGWSPYDREDWLLENLLSAPVAVGLVLARRRLPFTRLSWCLVFAFLALHEVGSHYTYSRVPLGDWIPGFSAGGRNHYDRLVHLSFGLLWTRPLAELLAWRVSASAALLQLLPICVVMTGSSLYELLEWLAARLTDPALGIAFVGAQGDVWDAQKDMALAFSGSCLATLANALTRVGRAKRERGA